MGCEGREEKNEISALETEKIARYKKAIQTTLQNNPLTVFEDTVVGKNES